MSPVYSGIPEKEDTPSIVDRVAYLNLRKSLKFYQPNLGCSMPLELTINGGNLDS